VTYFLRMLQICSILLTILSRYTLLSTTATLSSLDSFRWCLQRGCKSGQIHETGTDGPIFCCHACGFKICVIHDIKWHEGETCKEYDYRTNLKLKRKEESASAQTISRTTKQCPQSSCKAPIEKNDGCDHMTCKPSLDSADLRH
jgi:E3 ubiquitin-protein ligase RNF14